MTARELYEKLKDQGPTTPTEILANSLAEEMVQLELNDDAQTIANYIADNSDWEEALDLITAERGDYLTEAVMDDFISEVQFYMEELKEVQND